MVVTVDAANIKANFSVTLDAKIRINDACSEQARARNTFVYSRLVEESEASERRLW